MDGSPLDKAYTAAKNGDAAVLSGDFGKAAKYFSEAADFFDLVRKQSPENPSSRTLKALADQYREQADYFQSGRAASGRKQQHLSATNHNIPTSNVPPLPTQTGSNFDKSTSRNRKVLNEPNKSQSIAHATTSNVGATGGTPAYGTKSISANSGSQIDLGSGQSTIVAPMSEAVTSLVMRSAAVFARTFEQYCLEKSTQAAGKQHPGTSMAPTESFYLVKPSNTPSKGEPPRNTDSTSSGSRVTLSSFERSQAIEQATKAQKAVLQAGLGQLLHELATKEQQINDEHTEEVDRLRAENDRLRIQVSRLKSRWDDLKESARKRQTSE